MDVPQQVGKKDDECSQASEPYPFVGKDATLFGQQQSDHDPETKNCDGIFFLQSQSGHDAKTKPVARIAALDGEDGKVSAAHPQIRFQAVGSEQAAVGEILRCNQDGDCAQKKGEAAATEFASQKCGLYDQKRGGEGGQEANAAK